MAMLNNQKVKKHHIFSKAQLVAEQPSLWGSLGHLAFRQFQHQPRVGIAQHDHQVVLQGTVDGGAVEAIPRLPTAGGHGIVGFPRFGRSN